MNKGEFVRPFWRCAFLWEQNSCGEAAAHDAPARMLWLTGLDNPQRAACGKLDRENCGAAIAFLHQPFVVLGWYFVSTVRRHQDALAAPKAMISLYETHLPVSELARSSAFYRDVVGLVPAFAQPHRGVAFFYFGARERGMLGLWAPGSPWGWKPGETHRCHFAIAVTLPELLANVERLKSLGIELRGADDQPVKEPSVIGWMPSTQIYFHDPDGHLVEFISLLDEAPLPSFFGSLPAWREQRPVQ